MDPPVRHAHIYTSAYLYNFINAIHSTLVALYMNSATTNAFDMLLITQDGDLCAYNVAARSIIIIFEFPLWLISRRIIHV